MFYDGVLRVVFLVQRFGFRHVRVSMSYALQVKNHGLFVSDCLFSGMFDRCRALGSPQFCWAWLRVRQVVFKAFAAAADVRFMDGTDLNGRDDVEPALGFQAVRRLCFRRFQRRSFLVCFCASPH